MKRITLAMSLMACRAAALQEVPAGLVRLEKSETREANSVFFTGGYFRLSSPAGKVSGLEFNLGYRYAVSDKFAMGPKMRQALSRKDGFATLFTAIQIDLDYALWGALGSYQGSVELDGQRVYRYKDSEYGVLRIVVGVSQFFVNTTDFSVPFSGFGGGIRYDLPTQWSTMISIGAGIDRLTNAKLMVIPFQFYVGLSQPI